MLMHELQFFYNIFISHKKHKKEDFADKMLEKNSLVMQSQPLLYRNIYHIFI